MAVTPDARFDHVAVRALPGGLVLLLAEDRRARLRGLANLDPAGLPAGHALLLPHCRSVHTLGMRFDLDLVWLNGAGAAIRTDPAVPPGRLRTCLRARAVVEAHAGEGPAFARALAPAA